MSKADEHISTIIPTDPTVLKDERKLHRRRSIILEFGLTTSTHGLPGIARSESIHNRVFWSISFLAFLAIMIYFVVKAILAYFNYPTQFNLDIISEWPQYFPAVTICNNSPIRFDTFIEAFLNYTNSLNITNSNDTSTLSSRQANYFTDFLIYKINRNESLDSMFYPLSSMLYTCTYNSLPCSATDFISFTSSSYGLCYTFNAKMGNSSDGNIRYGNDNGGNGVLDLEFYVHSHQYIPYVTRGIGMVSLLHDNVQIPIIEAAGIELSPGRKHKLSYKKKKTTLLSSPYTSCTENVDLSMQAMLTHYNGADYGYAELICYQICQQVYAYVQCGCINPFLWNMRSVILPGTSEIIYPPLCNSTDICFVNAVNSLLISTDLVNTYCPDCSQQCLLIDFKIQTSSLAAPVEWEMNDIKAFVENSSIPLPSNWSTTWRTDIQGSYVAVSIVRETNVIENYTQTAQLGLVDVLSNIGGQTGLWIGISFLSLMEFIEMVYRLIRYQFHLIRVAIRRRQQIIIN